MGEASELILAISIPASLFVGVGADLWLGLLFGHAFAPATLALRILAASSVAIYIAIVYALTLIMLNRAWTLTVISLVGLVINMVLNLLLIPPSARYFGEGGSGVGCAIAALVTHVVAAGAMVAFAGRKAVNRHTVRMVAKSLLACVVVVVVDRVAASLGWVRLAVDAVVYLTLVVATGALRTGDMWRLVIAAVRSRGRVPA